MEILWAVEEDARRSLARARLFRNRTNVLEIYDDKRLITDFRFPKNEIMQIIDMCQSLQRKTLKPSALPVHIQVLTTLRFLARGTFQDDVKDIIGISQPSVSRIIGDVCSIICSRAHEFIKFPSEEEQKIIKVKFYEKYGFPNVIGIIDGTHIFIKTPSEEMETMFVCRKGGHSINVQLVCDFDMMITDIVVKWPGSTHDSFMWSTCGLRQTFVEQNPNGWLLGDEGYPCEPWLLTPFERPQNSSQQKFNKAFASNRSQVERTIGLFKSVFRRFDKSGGIILYEPRRVCQFIVAAAVLHNIRRTLKLPEDETFETPEFFDPPDNAANEMSANEITMRGNLVREEVCQNFFGF